MSNIDWKVLRLDRGRLVEYAEFQDLNIVLDQNDDLFLMNYTINGKFHLFLSENATEEDV